MRLISRAGLLLCGVFVVVKLGSAAQSVAPSPRGRSGALMVYDAGRRPALRLAVLAIRPTDVDLLERLGVESGSGTA